VNLENVRRDDWIVGGLALLLVIFLFVLPWFHLSVTVGPFSASADFTATDDPDGWLAILAVIAALALIADLAAERFAPQTDVPMIGGSRENTRFVLACVAAGFVALKFLFHIHFSDFGWGFYVCVIVTVALVYVALQARSGAPLAFAGLGTPGGRSRQAAPPPPPPPPPAPAGSSGESSGSEPSRGSTPPPGS
jgi:hypothetical protein